MPQSPVRELRLALTVEDYGRAVAFYRDGLGLPVVESFEGPDGSGVVLDAGRATLELLSVRQAEMVDRVEVGSRVAGPVRVALEVADSAEAARLLVAGGAEALAEPVPVEGDRLVVVLDRQRQAQLANRALRHGCPLVRPRCRTARVLAVSGRGGRS